MKKYLLTALLPALICGSTTANPRQIKQMKPMKVEDIVLNKELWTTKIADFQKKHAANGFKYMSAQKSAVRSTGQGFTLFGQKSGEVVIRAEKGLIESVSISLYNRGDDGGISMSVFNTNHKETIAKFTEKTGVRPREISKKGAVSLDRQLWMWENTAILLEKSISKDGGNPEFMRVRMKAKNAKSSGIRNRSAMRDNVVRDRATGDVYIKDVPMVDQGQKGYCAVASAARVYRYYGLEVDQHELAQIAGTGPNSGTSLSEMVASLKKITRHVRSRVLVLYEYPKGMADKKLKYSTYNNGLKEVARDLKKYNRAAEKQGKKTFPADVKTGVVSLQVFASQCDPAIYRDVMMAKSSYSRFNNKIKEYIDQGLPVGWCLQLGMFKEGNLPQSFGGHMRLIIGYNEKTKEIIYTDSWGAGHGKKRMPAGNAFCMSNALLALPPTK